MGLVHTFTELDEALPPSEPPITRIFSSSDGQWLAAVNCFGDIYVFNLEIQRLELSNIYVFFLVRNRYNFIP